jgi:hypothetical protein
MKIIVISGRHINGLRAGMPVPIRIFYIPCSGDVSGIAGIQMIGYDRHSGGIRVISNGIRSISKPGQMIQILRTGNIPVGRTMQDQRLGCHYFCVRLKRQNQTKNQGKQKM